MSDVHAVILAGGSGSLAFDTSKPGGMMCKLLEVYMLNALGWAALTCFSDGNAQACANYIDRTKEIV
jgi:hypothetical protein